MNDPWDDLYEMLSSKDLESSLLESTRAGDLDALLAPLGQESPRAAAWLAEAMGWADDYRWRSFGAVLAGWIDCADFPTILPAMFRSERIVHQHHPLDSLRVGEQLLIAGRRWSSSPNTKVRESGVRLLADMVGDVASGSIPWRNADAAAAALFIATSSDHNVFTWLQDIEKTDVPGHRELALAAKAIRERDIKTLKSLAAPPPATSILSHHDDRYRVIKKLWDAASRAEDLPM